jgi:hypothetical protein
VDGKKKSVGEEPKHTDMTPSPKVISHLQDQEFERKLTPMDVDSSSLKQVDHEAETSGHVKENPDGTICEECN